MWQRSMFKALSDIIAAILNSDLTQYIKVITIFIF